jgi:hypothetical protein
LLFDALGCYTGIYTIKEIDDMLAFDRQATRLAWVASLQAAQERLQWQGVVDNHRRGIAARDLSIRLMLDRRRDDADNQASLARLAFDGDYLGT